MYEISDIFNYFDKNGNGELDYNEMYEMASYINITKETMDDMIKEIDYDGDGNISLQEWSDYIVNMQKQMRQKKIIKRKSILQVVLEDKMLDQKDLCLDDQVSEWMRLQDKNVNI